MQPDASNPPLVAPTPAVPSGAVAGHTAVMPLDLPPIPDETARKNEELRMLIIGFATGLTIAGVFLVYVVLDYAKFLP